MKNTLFELLIIYTVITVPSTSSELIGVLSLKKKQAGKSAQLSVNRKWTALCKQEMDSRLKTGNGPQSVIRNCTAVCNQEMDSYL